MSMFDKNSMCLNLVPNIAIVHNNMFHTAMEHWILTEISDTNIVKKDCGDILNGDTQFIEQVAHPCDSARSFATYLYFALVDDRATTCCF